MLVDSHCHLNFPSLSADLENILQRALENGITVLNTICTKIEELDILLNIIENKVFANYGIKIFCSVGVHPLNVDQDLIIEASHLVELCHHPSVIGIGETGLDYYKSDQDPRIQRISFINHIIAAQKTGLPLIIHTRESDLDTVSILQEYMEKQPFSGVIHCFTASEWLAKSCLEMNLYLSASGILTFKNAQNIQKVFQEASIKRILIETDAPFLAPVPKRGQNNEPSYLKYTAEYLANLKECTYQEIAHATTNNFFTLFNKAKL